MLKSVKFFVILVAVLFTGITGIQAQDSNENSTNARQEFRQAQREKMQEFRQKEIEPILKKMKEQFDRAISKDDLAKLNDLRAKATKLRETHRAERQAYRDMVKANPDSCFCTERKERRAKAKAHRAEIQKIQDELEPIAEKYEKELSIVHESFEPELRAAREKMQKLRNEMRDEFRSEFRKDRKKGKGKGHKGHGRMDRKGNNGECLMTNQPERFLLWDGTSPADLDD